MSSHLANNISNSPLSPLSASGQAYVASRREKAIENLNHLRDDHFRYLANSRNITTPPLPENLRLPEILAKNLFESSTLTPPPTPDPEFQNAEFLDSEPANRGNITPRHPRDHHDIGPTPALSFPKSELEASLSPGLRINVDLNLSNPMFSPNQMHSMPISTQPASTLEFPSTVPSPGLRINVNLTLSNSSTTTSQTHSTFMHTSTSSSGLISPAPKTNPSKIPVFRKRTEYPNVITLARQEVARFQRQ